MTASQITYTTRPDTITVMRNPDWTLNATSPFPFVAVVNVPSFSFLTPGPRPYASYEQAMEFAQAIEVELHVLHCVYIDVVVEQGIDPELDEWLS